MPTTVDDDESRDGGPDRPRERRTDDLPHTRVSIRRGVRVIAPQGVFDDPVTAEVEALIDADPGQAVVDLGECVLTNVDVLQFLLTAQRDRAAAGLAVACRRGTGRQMLHRAGIHRQLAVFLSAEDAIQAHLFRRAGIGPGWDVTVSS
jgi:hypothetical protein